MEAVGRPIKSDDVASTLAQKANAPCSWTARKLSSANSFVACPSSVVQNLVAWSPILGEGYSLRVDRWDQNVQRIATQSELQSGSQSC